MSDIETKVHFHGTCARFESMPNGDPLGRPIYFKHVGAYLSIEQAERLVEELRHAVAAARSVEREHAKAKGQCS